LKPSGSNSEFWRDLAKEFRSLQTPSGEFRVDRWLSITGEVPPQSATWSISCSNRSVRQQWETLAKRGGDALSENDFVDAIRVWLERLRIEKINNTGEQHFSEGENVTGHGIQESITDLAEASAILCGIMESAALDRERIERAVKARTEVNQQPAGAGETLPVSPVEHESSTNERRTIVDQPPLSKLVEPQAGPVERTETVAQQLNRLREECRWTAADLAEEVKVEPRTVQRHLAGHSTPYDRNISAYECAFSKRLKRQVVIRKMS
jgi:hypothetical protein